MGLGLNKGMKALWKGTLTVALVSIPVKLYTAVKKRPVEFHLLHETCSTPLKYERYCPTCQREVDWSEVVRGYEYEKNKFVTFTEEELEAVFPKTNKMIEILSFVEPEEVDPLYFENPYYLAPEAGAEEAYVVLQRALLKTQKVGLARFALRDREHLALLRPYQKVLTLHTLHFAQEIVQPDFISLPEELELDRRIMALAEELIKTYSAPLRLEDYPDRSTEALMALVERKVAGEKVAVPPAKEVRKVVNLMEALERSLAAKGSRKKKRLAA